jgi:hypothetical protein
MVADGKAPDRHARTSTTGSAPKTSAALARFRNLASHIALSPPGRGKIFKVAYARIETRSRRAAFSVVR